MILLQAQNVARYFGADVLFENINLDIQDNSRIALVGRNGVGKTTLLKMIVGETEPDAGEIVKKHGITIGYLAQNSGLESSRTMLAEMESVFTYLKEMEQQIHSLEEKMADPQLAGSPEYEQILRRYDQLQHDFKEQNGYGYENEIKAVLHGFQFEPADFDRPVSSLSGGQKTRLALAKTRFIDS